MIMTTVVTLITSVEQVEQEVIETSSCSWGYKSLDQSSQLNFYTIRKYLMSGKSVTQKTDKQCSLWGREQNNNAVCEAENRTM
jgi:hypothetical protein